MHDKQVRRRRVVLALLVGCSLILLTAYFGESADSPLHSVQRGIVDVLSPIESGASKVLAPVRDLAGWVSDTIHAKSQNTTLRKEVNALTKEVDHAAIYEQRNAQMRGILKLDDSTDVKNYAPVAANVIGYNPSVWYENITIDHGSSAGIQDGDPVIASNGLVGDIASVGSDWAVIDELSSEKFAAGAAVIDPHGTWTGMLQPAVGNPTNLALNYLPQNAQVNNGDQVVTSGFKDPQDPTLVSCFPPGVPIGTVESTGYDADTNAVTVQVSPFVNLRQVSVVQVLTKHAVGGKGCG